MTINAPGARVEKASVPHTTIRIGERLAWLSWDRKPTVDDIAEGLVKLLDAPRFRQGIPVVIRLPDETCSLRYDDLKRAADDCWHLAEMIGRIGVIAKSPSTYHGAQLLSMLIAPCGIEMRVFFGHQAAVNWVLEEPPISKFKSWFSTARWQGTGTPVRICEAAGIAKIWDLFVSQNRRYRNDAALNAQATRYLTSFAHRSDRTGHNVLTGGLRF